MYYAWLYVSVSILFVILQLITKYVYLIDYILSIFWGVFWIVAMWQEAVSVCVFFIYLFSITRNDKARCLIRYHLLYHFVLLPPFGWGSRKNFIIDAVAIARQNGTSWMSVGECFCYRCYNIAVTNSFLPLGGSRHYQDLRGYTSDRWEL